jgi:hypothetical protein
MRPSTTTRDLPLLRAGMGAACLLCLLPNAVRGQKASFARPAAPEARPPVPRPPDTAQTVMVLSLKYADCKAVESILRELFGAQQRPGPRPTVVAEPRTNSLIVVAAKSDRDRIMQLVANLDVRPKPAWPDHLAVRIYRLRYVPADKTLTGLLTPLLGPKATLSLDAKRNQLVVRAGEETHNQLGALLQKVDVPTPVGETTTRRVRVVWLVAGLAGAPKAKRELLADLKNVTEELSKIGVTDLQLAAQFVARCVGTETFRAGGEAQLDGACQVEVHGQFVERPTGAVALKIGVTARQTRPPAATPGRAGRSFPEQVDIATLETMIVAPPDHAVVLGVTPMGKMTSVFVVTISEDKP